MSEPRFYVIECRGYGIAQSGQARLSSSYSVLDSAQCHHAVFDRFPDKGGTGNNERSLDLRWSTLGGTK